MGKNINQNLSATMRSINQDIQNIIHEFGKLSSYDLSKMFHLNRSEIDSSITKQVRELTNEINALSKAVLKTDADASWESLFSKTDSLYRVLSQFGKTRDLEPFRESLNLLKEFQGHKIFVPDKAELLQNTGMTMRELNNQFRNLGIIDEQLQKVGVTFTTVARNSINLDSIWEELFRFNPQIQQISNFGDQVNYIVKELQVAKEALQGDKNLYSNPQEASSVILDYMNKIEQAINKIRILKSQQQDLLTGQASNAKDSVTDTTDAIVQNETRKQEAYQQTEKIRQQTAEQIAQANSFVDREKWSGGFYTQQVLQQIEAYNRLGIELAQVKARIEELKAAETTFNQVMNDSNATIEQQRTAYENFQTALKTAKESNSIANNMYLTQNAVDNLILKFQQLLQSNTKLTSTAQAEINQWIAKLQETGGVYKSTGNDAVAALKRIKAEQQKVSKSSSSFFGSLKNGMSIFSYWLSPMFMLMRFIAKVKQAFTELKEVNSILTEISKVSEMTSKELKKLGDEAFETASKYGRTISDYLTGVQDMTRAGFQGKKSEEMAELSVLAQAAGNLDATLANEYLLATNAGYKLNGQVKALNDILDGQNYIANRNAVSMEHLAKATKVVASQAESSGVSINEMSAAVGTMVAVTQQSGEVAGRAFKGILMNLQQVSGELEDGEIIDEESFTKYEKACNQLGVSLKEVKDGIVSLRDPMEILKELSQAYTSLDKMDARRANLISAVGGKYRGNQLNALLENWSTYEKMLSDYSQGTGSAMREAMKSANNWEGSLNRLKNTWVDTVENIAQSDAMITIINGANSLLDVLNKLTSKLGSIGSIGLGAFAFLNRG